MSINLKLAEALEIWRVALSASVRDEDAPDLTARQMAILLNVYSGTGSYTVRGLASDLRVSKPAITRALDRLQDLGYIKRRTDEEDRRSIIVQRTIKGSVYLSDFAEHVVSALKNLNPDLLSDAELLTL
ncbi:MAG: MarR family transcriptional regulator [Alphaproteobacteria bacterium]|jgi:DNA-binding MarR family transcriptional regulator|nr:MarR family transcriptional regulator [Alphaproteobacteria bacterium]